MVVKLQDGSPAKRAGLQVGDFVLNVAGQDTRDWEGEAVLRLLQEQAGREVAVRVARGDPIPVSDSERMKALLVLQTKVGWSGCPPSAADQGGLVGVPS